MLTILPLAAEKNPDEPDDHALGRSNSGFTMIIHLLDDGVGHLLAFIITGGQAHETTALGDVLDQADQNFRVAEGNSIASPANLAGDKAYRAG